MLCVQGKFVSIHFLLKQRKKLMLKKRKEVRSQFQSTSFLNKGRNI
ncbi:hypothetical protein LEP1GSC081_3120 [Leptospira kirschneri str. H1]|uniref:Uncharacterized protein n=1 Tax=Leptospira kirschneri str. H1 TaxID=1049966 RepID=A0A0E2B9Q7_9LEPT|nr:hypothetical protein LEP1GSC081_3120 [Leptospira kirschneri str. H1]